MDRYNLETVKEKYGVDLSKIPLNSFGKIAYEEFVSGIISKDTIDSSILELDKKISETEDPKLVKELSKKRENLVALYQRDEKPISTEQEDKWSSYFSRVDSIINQLEIGLRTKLVSNVLINENPLWHRERNSLVHIKIVTSRALSTGDDDLVRAAIFHDIAKFDTLSFNRNGWPTCLGHDVKGYQLASGENELVRWICLNHMKIKGWTGDSESPGMKENTKREMFLSSPGDGLDDKAKSFWKLCQFTKMDDMNKDFNTSSLLWKNPGFENWDNECPLRDSFRTDEFIEKKNVIQKVRESSPLAAQELIEMGLKGPQIGTVLSQIRGKTPEQAREIARMYLTNEAKTWIKSFDRFRK
jgi:hypothetical protein